MFCRRDHFSNNWLIFPARLLNSEHKELVLKEAKRIDRDSPNRDYSGCIDFRRTHLSRLDKNQEDRMHGRLL